MASEFGTGSLTVQVVENALVVPFGDGPARGIRRPAGIFDQTGKLVRRAHCWRTSHLRVTSAPPLPDEADIRQTLSGTWVFGGMLYAHFGHFLCESTGRLWALDQPDLQIDGLLFHAKKRVTWPKRFLKPILPWLQIANVSVPVELPMQPCRVDRLLIPDQAFGTGDMIGGTPEFHDFVRRNFGREVQPEGSEKIYISRSRLFSKRGRILGEAQFEAWLAAEGYTIFHPQEHPIEVQIAQYKAARCIVSTDCSALHLAAFFAEPSDRIAIITRRPGDTVQEFARQYRSFAGVEPLVIDCIRSLYSYDGAKVSQMSEVYSDIDYARLGCLLADGGYVAKGSGWTGPTPAEIAEELQDLGQRLGTAVERMEMLPA